VNGANNLPVCGFSCTQLSIGQREEICHLSLKEGFCGVCIEKGARSFVDIKQNKEIDGSVASK